MAQFTIEIPDAKVDRVFAAFGDMVPDDESLGVFATMVLVPTDARGLGQKLADYAISRTVDAEVTDVVEQARLAKLDQVSKEDWGVVVSDAKVAVGGSVKG